MENRVKVEDHLRPTALPTFWCPGCGHGIIVQAAVRAILKLGLKKDEVVALSGIGCHARAPAFCDYNSLQTTHGRALAFATGIKMHNPHLSIFLFLGDGDCAAIGGNHFMHAAKRNIDMTVIVMNNYIYGMTGGQVSPTTPLHGYSTTTPFGNIEPQLDICSIALAAGATFVARTTAYHVTQLTNYIERGIKNKGFSVIECMDPCPTGYGRKNKFATPVAMYEMLRDKAVSRAKAEKMSPEELQDKIIIGVLRDNTRPEYAEEYHKMASKEREQYQEETSYLEIDEEQDHTPLRRCEVRFSGSGGQGIVLAGIMLAEAGIRQGKNGVHTQSYGPESRGGAARSEVVLSDGEIHFPEVKNPDVLLAMTQLSVDKYADFVKPGGLTLCDTTYVQKLPEVNAKVYGYPITQEAIAKFGRAMVANVMALGMLVRLTGLVSIKSMEKAVLARVPESAAALNSKALQEGFKLAGELTCQ